LPWLSQVVNNSGSWTRILRFLFALLRLGINHNMDRADLDLRYAACISYHPFVYRLGQSTGPINLRLGRNRNYLVQIQNRFLNKCKITKKFKPVVPSIRPWPWPTMLNVPSESKKVVIQHSDSHTTPPPLSYLLTWNLLPVPVLVFLIL
jgi:hypothetical protein